MDRREKPKSIILPLQFKEKTRHSKDAYKVNNAMHLQNNMKFLYLLSIFLRMGHN